MTEIASDKQLLSSARIKRLKAQGYCGISDREISDLAFGNRFAYILCSVVLIYGVATANVPVLMGMTVIAFLSIVLPNHAFDYIYNGVLAGPMNKPKLPPRSKQLKFSCTIATLWLIATIYLFYTGASTAGYIVGGLLVAVALLLSTTDFCIPSWIYNRIFKVETE